MCTSLSGPVSIETLGEGSGIVKQPKFVSLRLTIIDLFGTKVIPTLQMTVMSTEQMSCRGRRKVLEWHHKSVISGVITVFKYPQISLGRRGDKIWNGYATLALNQSILAE